MSLVLYDGIAVVGAQLSAGLVLYDGIAVVGAQPSAGLVLYDGIAVSEAQPSTGPVLYDGIAVPGIIGNQVMWLQDFEQNATDGIHLSGNATATRYVSWSAGPIGSIPSLTGNYYCAFGLDTTSGYDTMFGTSFDQVTDASNSDFLQAPFKYRYLGPFTEEISIYIPCSGPNAWAPPANTAVAAFELWFMPNIQLNGGGSYALESNVMVSTTGPGNVVFWWSNDSNYTNTGPAPWCTITRSDWYTFAVSYYRAGNLTTDGGIQLWQVFNSSGVLQGFLALSASTTSGSLGNENEVATPSVGVIPSSGLFASDQIAAFYWQPGFGNDVLCVDRLRWYLDFPNPTARPRIQTPLNVYGTHNVAFRYQIAATNNPTLFRINGLPLGLAYERSTGTISGTVTTAGTTQIITAAANSTGVDAQRINIIMA